MNLRALFVLVLVFGISINTFAQEMTEFSSDNFKKLELSNKVINGEEFSPEQDVELENVNASKKSVGISLLLSLLLPGAGHYYLDRMDAGQYFLLGEGASWLGLAGVNIYGNIIRDNAETFARDHGSAQIDGKDEDYFVNIGNYRNIYDYNNEKLSFGEYEKVYSDVDKFYWNWDNDNNLLRYKAQRGESERIKNTSVIFASALIVNRIASAISAIVLTNQHNNALSNMKLNSELMTGYGNRIDGVKLNLIKEF
jgi:hypothetical protein